MADKKGGQPEYVLIDNKTGRKITGDEARRMVEPDWEHECEVCGAAPVVPMTGLCGPCTFGEAETAGGNW